MIYVVIPVFNRWHYTQACLISLQNQSYGLIKVIVVDHGSSDRTSESIKRDFPEVVLLKGNEKMWWSAATNLGISYALQNNATYILTLNNDTVAEPDYIEKLVEATSLAPMNSLIGSTAIDIKTKQVLYKGEYLTWFSWLTETSINNKDSNKQADKFFFEVSHYPGRGLLIPANVFAKTGLIDEKNFPHYMADYEFTLRARKAGFKIFCASNALLGIYPEASGANQIKIKKTIKSYYDHLFGMKGGANLPLFYKYAFRHCPFYALPSFLFLGTLRRVVGFWLTK